MNIRTAIQAIGPTAKGLSFRIRQDVVHVCGEGMIARIPGELPEVGSISIPKPVLRTAKACPDLADISSAKIVNSSLVIGDVSISGFTPGLPAIPDIWSGRGENLAAVEVEPKTLRQLAAVASTPLNQTWVQGETAFVRPTNSLSVELPTTSVPDGWYPALLFDRARRALRAYKDIDRAYVLTTQPGKLEVIWGLRLVSQGTEVDISVPHVYRATPQLRKDYGEVDKIWTVPYQALKQFCSILPSSGYMTLRVRNHILEGIAVANNLVIRRELGKVDALEDVPADRSFELDTMQYILANTKDNWLRLGCYPVAENGAAPAKVLSKTTTLGTMTAVGIDLNFSSFRMKDALV